MLNEIDSLPRVGVSLVQRRIAASAHAVFEETNMIVWLPVHFEWGVVEEKGRGRSVRLLQLRELVIPNVADVLGCGRLAIW